MLKIGKGLKKKKKSKKNKHKEDELFTEEELERYRKEHSQKISEELGENSEGKKGTSEELEKFKLLTAGVDDILRKSQGDLDRIKKESFFQRKPTPSELKALEEKEKQEAKLTEGNWIGFEDKNKPEANQTPDGEKEEESESEYEFDDSDDIFDTTYVEAVESGEVKLVYVPDDDDTIKADEPDPFDTTSAEAILKKVEEEEKKKKSQISLGLAVQVLTGRAERDKTILEEAGAAEVLESKENQLNKPRQRPRKIQDIVLIGSFEEGNDQNIVTSDFVPEKAPELSKSILDDDLNLSCVLPEGEVLLNEVLTHKSSSNLDGKANINESNTTDFNDLVNEFDIIHETTTPEVKKAEEVEDQFDEFTALAESSVANQKLEEELQKFEVSEDDPFDTSNATIVLKVQGDPFGNINSKVPAPQIIDLSTSNQKWSAFDSDNCQSAEHDPFDTTFAEKIQPGKCELKLLESEILGDVVESALKTDIHREARILSRNNSDTDFKPREEDLTKPNHQSFFSKVSIQITDPSGFVETQRGSENESKEDIVSLGFHHRDLLGGSTTDLTKLGNDPLPPEIESPIEDFSKYSDPFDTSIVDQVAIPGKAELKFIEKELLSDISKVENDEDTLSDKDFDPRKEERLIQKVSFNIPSSINPDFPVTREEVGRPLTPFYSNNKDAESDTGELDDPFNTSHIASLPGKEELKLIEKELNSVQITSTVIDPCQEAYASFPGLKHSLSDQDFNSSKVSDRNLATEYNTSIARRFSDISGGVKAHPSSLNFQPEKPDLLNALEEHSVKALTPAIEEDISSYTDPFDTSIAERIAPGKAELKVLESELISDTASGVPEIKRSYTDPDFNPRSESNVDKPDTNDILTFKEGTAINVKPLSPLDFEIGNEDENDPFDTSIATNLLPGKAEIRILESELFGQ